MHYVMSMENSGGSGDPDTLTTYVHLYDCPEHGRWGLTPSGRVYPHPLKA
jgi:hypothetical protein